MAAPAILLMLLLLAGQEIHCADKRSPAFGYDGDIGPEHWAKNYDTCAGKFQSPVDIEEHLVGQVRLPPLQFRGFHTFPVASTLTNNGHTVMLQMNRTEEAIVSGGPLSGDYTFAQLHFHWGANDSIGSEDTINNHTFPLELHLVFFKKEYGDFNNAMHYEDGLTVLAVFFEVYGSDNEVYSEIVAYLPKVSAPGSTAQLLRPVTLESFLPENKHLYFTYHGSLTTPPCSEIVIWIDFKQPILLSHRQVASFRRMQSDHGRLTQNFRPIQPLSGRLIQFNVANDMSSASVRGRYFSRAACLSFALLLRVLLW